MGAYNVRFGEVLMQQTLMSYGIKHQLASDDLNAGPQYALGQGWITQNSNKNYVLTDAGYTEV